METRCCNKRTPLYWSVSICPRISPLRMNALCLVRLRTSGLRRVSSAISLRPARFIEKSIPDHTQTSQICHSLQQSDWLKSLLPPQSDLHQSAFHLGEPYVVRVFECHKCDCMHAYYVRPVARRWQCHAGTQMLTLQSSPPRCSANDSTTTGSKPFLGT